MNSPSSRWAAVLLPLLLFVAGCANPINLKNAERYYDSGLRASGAGDHYEAAIYYSRAYGNATVGRAPAAGLAMTSYAYGRELALLGEFDEATELLEESLRTQREVEPFDAVNVMRRTAVLGRIYLDTGRPGDALPYFREAVELFRGWADAEEHAGDLMYLLTDLEAAALAAGSATEVEEIRAELAALRGEHGDEGPGSIYARFTPEDVRLRIAADTSRARWEAE